MKTQVIMKRELFGIEISQQSKTEFFSATELTRAGNNWRVANGMTPFNLTQFLRSKSTVEFIEEIEKKYFLKAVTSGKGRNSQTWVHPILFIDIALAIDPKLKLEVYDWLFDNLIKFRNDSGDSFKKMSGAIYVNFSNKKEFPEYIKRVSNYIKKEIGVSDWQTATEEQLKKRDKMHDSISLLCNVLKNTDQAVRLGVKENIN